MVDRAAVLAIAFSMALPLCLASDVPPCTAEEACPPEAHLEDDDEAALVEVQLLQRNARVAPKVLAEAPLVPAGLVGEGADAEARAAPADTRATGEASHNDAADAPSLSTYDHNGRLCMLCDKPLPSRLAEGKNYTAFRSDCGGLSSSTGPSAADLMRPAVEFIQATGGKRNGFCELNFAKSCVDAVANKDYLYWAKSIDLNHADMRENAKWDAHYCKINGFLSHETVRLQHDFSGLHNRADMLCKGKYVPHGIENITFKDILAGRSGSLPTTEEAEHLAAWNCAMGDLGCDMAMCAYSFCELADGNVGLYDECAGWSPINGMPIPK